MDQEDADAFPERHLEAARSARDGEQYEDRGDDADDHREAESDAQPVDQCGEQDANDYCDHGLDSTPRLALPTLLPARRSRR